MRLPNSFHRLPFQVDHQCLQAEINNIPEHAWRPHPSGFAGNSSLPLVSHKGEDNDDLHGEMQACPRLQHFPYIQQIMAALGTVVGRSRLMRLAPGAEVKRHCDINAYWRNRFRIHIPISTHPSIRFYSDPEHPAEESDQMHMAAGEVWTLDTWKQHWVKNPSHTTRIHLVIDTVGSAQLWQQLKQTVPSAITEISFQSDHPAPQIPMESNPQTEVMHPAELQVEFARITEQDISRTMQQHPSVLQWQQITSTFLHHWQNLWVRFGPQITQQHQRCLRQTFTQIAALENTPLSPINSVSLQAITLAMLKAALTPAAVAQALITEAQPSTAKRHQPGLPRFDRPIFIVAAPRSGSTLLFETLAKNRALWNLGDESHQHFESIPALHPSTHNYSSNRLLAAHATAPVQQQLHQNFCQSLQNSAGGHWLSLTPEQRPAQLRFLEKTPKNALRIPFLKALYPDAKFIYLYRNPRDNISSLLDSWRSGRYITYPKLPQWQGLPWSHLLIPEWQTLKQQSLIDIVTQQWIKTNQQILQDLKQMADTDWCLVKYEDFIHFTDAELQRLTEFAEIPFGSQMQAAASQPLAPSKYTLTLPRKDKWKKNAAELSRLDEQADKLYFLLNHLNAEDNRSVSA